MIPIMIAIGVSVIGIILFNIVKEGAAHNNVKKFFASLFALVPIISIIILLMWISYIELGDYQRLKDNKNTITQEILTGQLNNNLSTETLKRADIHNKECEVHFNKYQKNIMWSVLGKFRKSALYFKIELPQTGEMSEIEVSTSQINEPTYQTTIINGKEYELVPKE